MIQVEKIIRKQVYESTQVSSKVFFLALFSADREFLTLPENTKANHTDIEEEAKGLQEN